MSKRFLNYWLENIRSSKDGFDVFMLIVTGGLFIVWFGCKILDFRTPNETDVANWCLFGAGLFFFAWCFVWLPFRRHEQLTAELQANTIDLKITAEMSIEHTKNIHGLLTVTVLNKGKKEAKIRRVAVLIMPDTFTTLSKAPKDNNSQLISEAGELILNPNSAITKIQGDEGLHEWNQELLNNPHFVSNEKDRLQYGQGYVELTSKLKLPFEFQLLPDDSWSVIRSQTFRAV